MKTDGSAVWQGGIKDDKSAISTKSGALKEYPYGFSSRFEGKPDELAAKAKAGCPVSKLLNAKITLDATLVD